MNRKDLTKTVMIIKHFHLQGFHKNFSALTLLSASLLLNIFLSFEVGIAHAIANFKWKENTSSLKN